MFQFALVLCASFGLSYSLNLRSVQEGSCRNNPAIQTLRALDVEPTWLDTLHYVAAGGKYTLFRHSTSHPRFREMDEVKFENEACYVKNTSIIEGNGSMFGFGGRLLSSFEFQVRPSRNGTIEVGVPSSPQTGPVSDFYTQRVTLTDYRTFAVMVQCWEGVDQRSWDVFALTPGLDRRTQRLIEDHVEALGFNRDNFMFFNYENCGNLEGPLRQNRPGGPRGNQGGEYKQQTGGYRPSPTRPGAGNQSGSLKRVSTRSGAQKQSRGLGWSSN